MSIEVFERISSEIMKDPNKIIQMPIRIQDGIRDKLKIIAIKKGLTLNELLLEYVMEGYDKDKTK